MTKCNMLPNCTSVCTNLLKNTPSYADRTEEEAFMDCCMPQRRQVGRCTSLARFEQAGKPGKKMAKRNARVLHSRWSHVYTGTGS